MSDHSLLTEAEIDHMERRAADLTRAGRLDYPWTTHTVMCALATIRDRDARLADAAAQIEALRADVERGRNALGVAREALRRLANAADDVGVRFFDADTMEPEVEEMQDATQEARRLLVKINALTGES